MYIIFSIVYLFSSKKNFNKISIHFNFNEIVIPSTNIRMISFNFLHCNLNFNINTNYNKIEIFILRIIMNSLNLNNKYLFFNKFWVQ